MLPVYCVSDVPGPDQVRYRSLTVTALYRLQEVHGLEDLVEPGVAAEGIVGGVHFEGHDG